MLADRRVALAFEPAVEKGELPGGRGLLGQDAVAAAEISESVEWLANLRASYAKSPGGWPDWLGK